MNNQSSELGINIDKWKAIVRELDKLIADSYMRVGNLSKAEWLAFLSMYEKDVATLLNNKAGWCVSMDTDAALGAFDSVEIQAAPTLFQAWLDLTLTALQSLHERRFTVDLTYLQCL